MKRKGVTPVIAIIMLLLIVVVMVGGVFAWMQTMQEDVEGMTEEELASFIEEAEDHISIENYECESGGSDDPEVSKVYVRNTDEVDDYNVTAYVDGAKKDEDIELTKDSLTELFDESDLSQDDIMRGDTLELSMEGDTIASETFSC
ncbi:MAG: archaellin/type IV pilin N-terminal domain-containing protein [Candidatus Aenigmatarchaeota archaeon]